MLSKVLVGQSNQNNYLRLSLIYCFDNWPNEKSRSGQREEIEYIVLLVKEKELNRSQEQPSFGT
jgi:hypothetical protein